MVSRWKKSVASSPDACVRRNVRQLVSASRGAGPILAAARIRRIAVERAAVFAVPIADQEPEPAGLFVEFHDEVTGLLDHPSTVRMRGDAEQVDASGGHFHHDQYVEPLEQDRVDGNVAGVTSRWARIAVGSSRARADRIARSGQDNRGRPFSCRRSTATSWRRARTSASAAASLRISSPRAPTSRIIIRYTSRTNIPMILGANRKIPAHRVCDKFWHGTPPPACCDTQDRVAVRLLLTERSLAARCPSVFVFAMSVAPGPH
jgi:hypothetical protein